MYKFTLVLQASPRPIRWTLLTDFIFSCGLYLYLTKQNESSISPHSCIHNVPFIWDATSGLFDISHVSYKDPIRSIYVYVFFSILCSMSCSLLRSNFPRNINDAFLPSNWHWLNIDEICSMCRHHIDLMMRQYRQHWAVD